MFSEITVFRSFVPLFVQIPPEEQDLCKEIPAVKDSGMLPRVMVAPSPDWAWLIGPIVKCPRSGPGVPGDWAVLGFAIGASSQGLLEVLDSSVHLIKEFQPTEHNYVYARTGFIFQEGEVIKGELFNWKGEPMDRLPMC